jgi:DNA helicase-2/ATP-dependent DNA helicase PcrA
MELDKESFKPSALLSKIGTVKSELKDISEYFESADKREQIFAEVFTRYERALIEQNAFDFDDLIEKPVRIMLADPKVKEHYQNIISQVLVDEYQDVNTTQYQLVKLLAEKHQNVSVVGDDFQSIYQFRGADMRNFLNFTRDWPNATIIKLEQNYRSTSNIISAASAVIANNKVQTPKKLWTENPAGEMVKIIAAEDQNSEAEWIAKEIRNLRRKDREAEIAILYRTNAQSRAIEQALISANLPYKIYGGLKFYDRKEIKDVLAGLRLALNPQDAVSAERLAKSLGKRASATVIEKISGKGNDLPAAELIDLFLLSANYTELLEKDFNNSQERAENISELINFASSFTTLEEFLERAALLGSSDAPDGRSKETNSPSNDGSYVSNAPINLMTVHVAKGLEFDNVFIAGVNEGMLPHERSMTSDSQVEEERRLMYVAMTRAKKMLYILFFSFASRFIYEIPKDLCTFESSGGAYRELSSNDDEMWLEQ